MLAAVGDRRLVRVIVRRDEQLALQSYVDAIADLSPAWIVAVTRHRTYGLVIASDLDAERRIASRYRCMLGTDDAIAVSIVPVSGFDAPDPAERRAHLDRVIGFALSVALTPYEDASSGVLADAFDVEGLADLAVALRVKHDEERAARKAARALTRGDRG